MKLRLVIDDKDLMGAILLKWYGFAYRQFEIRRTVLYPMPLNLAVRYIMKIYWRFYRWLKAGGWQEKLDEAYRQGYNDGNTNREHHYDRLARILQGKEDV